MYVVNLGGQYHDDVCAPDSKAPKQQQVLTSQTVLYRSRDQAGIQELRRGLRHPIQGLPHHLRLGAWYVTTTDSCSSIANLLDT